MRTTTPARFIWATELLTVKSTDKILEIGCGAGLLAEQIADRLTTGQLLAVDKSKPLLEKATHRNKRFIASGVAKFVAADFITSELPPLYFDRIVAFNVNFFWRSPVKELPIIKQLLHPEGRLFVFFQAPYEIDGSSVEPIKQALVANEFRILAVQFEKFVPTNACCIIASI